MKTRKNLVLLIIFIGVFGMVFLSGNLPVTAQDDTSLQDVIDRGKLIVGSDTTYPPFEEINPDTDTVEGFDVEIAHQMAIGIGVELSFKVSDWTPIIPNLQSEKFDIIISAMTITADREKEVDFTRWYYKSFQGILVAANNPENITTELDLNNASLSTGMQAGTTSHIFANDSLQDGDIKTYEDVPTAIEALKLGTLDAVLADLAVLQLDAAESTETEVLPHVFSPEDFGFAVRTGGDALRGKLNTLIDGLLGTNQSDPVATDLYNTMYFKWFGFNAPSYSGTVTNAAIPTTALELIKGGGIPGFEFIAIIALGAIPILRKFRK